VDNPQVATTFGKYQLIERLAAGGMGEVHLARLTGAKGFEKQLVIKRVLPHLADDPEFLSQFLDEARLAATLNHPNVAQIFELGEIDGTWYLAMEYVRGQDLRKILRRANGPLPLGIAARIISNAAAGLDYAHKATDANGRALNVVHRDVSPHNLLVGFDGAVKLIDFGIARAANRAQRTVSGALRGKVPYLSPEMVDGEPVDHRTDIFSLGIVLWESLTGAPLFRAPSEPVTLKRVSACQVAAPSSLNPLVPAPLDAICLRALERSPERRYPEAAAFRLELEGFIVQARLQASAAHLERYLRELFSQPEPAAPDLAPAGRGCAAPPPSRQWARR
jgi:eukaryotic-like serine/threonine-protein kinase